MSLLRASETCWRAPSAGRIKLLVDGQAYYRTLLRALTGARRSIHMLSWSFDPRTEMTPDAAPALDGDARRAVEHRGSHMQIIACAGSGKTEVVAQRVADLIADGADPAGIIAFTFTERAAEELKARISARVEGA